MEEGVKPVVDPSLLKLIDPTQEFLFGLGEPWEPEAWDVKNTDEDSVFIAPSQVVDQVVEESKSRWGSPKSCDELIKMREEAILIATRKQTNWSLSVWSKWVSHRSERLKEEADTSHTLLSRIRRCNERK
jgi:hypothetical protein